MDVLLLIETFCCEIKKSADLWIDPTRKESSPSCHEKFYLPCRIIGIIFMRFAEF